MHKIDVKLTAEQRRWLEDQGKVAGSMSRTMRDLVEKQRTLAKAARDTPGHQPQQR
jgi:hypothetical protein